MRTFFVSLLAGLLASAAGLGADRPPMGWNSWDCYGTTVTEAEVKANAEAMAAKLKSHGWQYIVVDIQWSEPNAKAHGYRENAELAMDANGRLQPAVNRFPSSANGAGFKPLADFVHARGLKFGIHIMRGIPRQAVRARTPVAGTKVTAAEIANPNSICRWNTDMFGVDVSKPEGQAYYDSLLQLYAAWGVDFIKADDMLRPYHDDEIAALAQAIRKTGRPIVLSLSPGEPPLDKAEHLQKNANLWRVSDDFWDRWQDLYKNFDLLQKWAAFAGPGHWPDGDMLPLGHIGIRAERGDDRQTRFTPVEQQTLMTLWSIAQSPLMFGGDLATLDAATLKLITNDEVLAVNQHARGARQLFRQGNQVVWTARDPRDGVVYAALFHIGDSGAEKVGVRWRELGLPSRCRVRNLWSRIDLGTLENETGFQIGPHASELIRITPVASGRKDK